MLFHFGYLPVGWVGVQIFFVLSGYLITKILLADKSSSPQHYFARFYWRRTLRIFPLYYVFMVALTIAYMMSGHPNSLPSDWPWLVTYSANFARLRDGDLPNVVHLWSLAVEEQFYLMWPFVVFITSRWTLRRVVIGLLVAAPVLRVVVFAALQWTGADAVYAGKAVYVLPFTQMDAFAAGAAISLFGLEKMRHAQTWLLACAGVAAVAGISVLMAGHLWYGGAFFMSFGFQMYMTSFFEYAWGYSVINITSLVFIVCILQRYWFARAVDNAYMARIGKISYGIYVYHLPLLTIARALVDPHDWLGRFVVFLGWLIIVLVTAEASFRFLESRFLRFKDFFPVVVGRQSSSP